MNVYVYCDGTKRNKDGNIPVSIAVKNKNGRFFVNTGLTTIEKFTGREFPKSEKNRIAKNGALNRYIAKIEEICSKQRLVQRCLAKVCVLIKRLLTMYANTWIVLFLMERKRCMLVQNDT